MNPQSEGVSSPDSRRESSLAVAERILTACLQESAVHNRKSVDRICRERPDLAEALRDRLVGARAAGFASGMPIQQIPFEPLRSDLSGTETEENVEFDPIGHYQPLQELGRGGQGRVFLAEDLRLHRQVALKVFRGPGVLSEPGLRRFLREAEVAAKLDQPGICGVYDVDVDADTAYIAMRYIQGDTLADRITEATSSADPGSQCDCLDLCPSTSVSDEEPSSRKAGSLRQKILRIVETIEKAARILHTAHEANIIHRDIKPANIMIIPDGNPVLMDFGLASDQAWPSSHLTRTGELLGTPAYMSPEQLMPKRRPLDRRTDVFSLGVTLYECLTLRRPFEAPTGEGVFRAILDQDPPDPRKHNPQVPPDLRIVLDKALEKDRDRRYGTAQSLAEDLRRVREGKPIAARPVSAAGRLARWARRRPVRTMLVLALVLGLPIVTGLGAYVLARIPEVRAAWEKEREEEVEKHLTDGYIAQAQRTEASYGDALLAFDEALRLEPDCVEAVGGKALIPYAQKKYADLLRILDRHADLESSTSGLSRLRAVALRELDRRAEADDLAERIPVPTEPYDFFVAGLLADRWKAMRRDTATDATLSLFKAVLLSDRPRHVYYTELANKAYAAGDRVLCRATARALTLLWPDSPSAWCSAGLALSHHDPEASFAAYRRAVELNPDLVEAHLNLAHVLAARQRLDEAMKEARRALELAPDDARTHLTMATMLAHRGKFKEAIEACGRAREIRPDYVNVYNRLGWIYVSMRRFDRAIENFRMAHDLDPKNAAAHHNLGWAYLRNNEFDAAALHLEKALELDPDHGQAHQILSEARARQGRYDMAIHHARRAVELIPMGGGVHPNLIQLLHDEGRWGEALVAAKKFLQLHKNNGKANYCLGWFLANLHGRSREAIRYYRKALPTSRKALILYLNLGMALLEVGDIRSALRSFRRGSTLKASTPAQKDELNQLKGNVRLCERMLELAPRLDAVLDGTAEPASPREARTLAMIAFYKRRFGAGTNLFILAFGEDPALADESDPSFGGGQSFRFTAACTAVQAGSGRGVDAGNFDRGNRFAWRRKAVAWLEEDLTRLAAAVDRSPAEKKKLKGKLHTWRQHWSLADLREPNRQVKLRSDEQDACRALWARVEMLLEKVKGQNRS